MLRDEKGNLTRSRRIMSIRRVAIVTGILFVLAAPLFLDAVVAGSVPVRGLPPARAGVLAAGARGQASNTVTFVGISGFLIEVDGKKVLIDGLSNFTPPAVEQRLFAGEAPFDGLDLVMATHSHGDHFKAASVGRCLQNHPRAAFVAPTDAADQVSGFQGRVFPIRADEGKRTVLEVNGIRIQAMPLSHGIPPAGVPGIVNLGYLVTIGSVSFFHTGDIDPSQLTPELLRALGLPGENVDFAFVPGFFLAMPEPPPFVTEGIRPRVFIAAHLPRAGQEPLDYAAIRRNFPTAVLFKSELDSWTIK